MRLSKMAVPKILAVTLLGLSLAACVPSPKKADSSEDTGANFALDSVSGDVTGTKTDAVFSLPTVRTYSYNVCLKDLSRAKPLTGQEFTIKELGTNVRADSAGCIHWSEDLAFNYLADSANVALERTIKALGPAKGSVKAEIGVNPWKHSDKEDGKAIDLNKSKAPNLIDDVNLVREHLAGKIKGVLVSRPLWLDKLSLNVDSTSNGNGLNLKYDIYGSPQISVLNIDGQKVLSSLRSGDFKATVSLIREDIVNGNSVRRVLISKDIDKAQINNDALGLSAAFTIPNLPYSGQLYLGLKLTPLNAPAGLTAFEGLYPMGDFSTINKGGSLTISSDVVANQNFTLADFVASKTTSNSVSSTSPANDSLISPDSFSFQSEQNAYEYQIDQALNLQTVKKINFHMDAKIVDSRNSAFVLLRDGTYVLRLVILRNPDYTSNNNYVTHFEKIVSVLKGAVQVSNMRLSTYDLRAVSDRNHLLIDLEPVDLTKITTQADGTIVPMNGLRIVDTISHDAGLKGQLMYSPVTISSTYEHQALTPVDPSALKEMIGQAKGQDPIDAIIQRGLAQRAVQLQKNSQVQTPELAAKISGLRFISVTGKPDQAVLKTLGADPLTYKIKALTTSNTDMWQRYHDSLMPAKNDVLRPLAQGKMSAEMAERLCLVFAYDLLGPALTERGARRLSRDCISASEKNPSAYLALEPRWIVHKLNSYANPTIMPKRLFTENVSFSLNENYSESTSTHASLGIGGQAGFQPTAFLGLGVEAGVGMSWDRSLGSSVGNGIAFTTGNAPIAIREMRFDLQIGEAERCVAVRLQPSIFKQKTGWLKLIPFIGASGMDGIFSRSLTAPQKLAAVSRGLMVCTGQVEKTTAKVNEKYFFVSQDPDPTEGLQDPFAGQNRFFIGLRGESDYNRFMQYISASGHIPGTESDERLDEPLIEFLKTQLSHSPTLPGHYFPSVPAPQ